MISKKSKTPNICPPIFIVVAPLVVVWNHFLCPITASAQVNSDRIPQLLRDQAGKVLRSVRQGQRAQESLREHRRQRPSSPPADADTAATQDEKHVKNMQRVLSRLGHSIGDIDGVWGEKGRAAAKIEQRRMRHPETGWLTHSQLQYLRAKGGGQNPAVPPIETSFQDEDDLSRTVRMQRALKQRGYDVGDIDGRWGDKARASASQFQSANNYPITGRLNPRELRHLETGHAPATADAVASNSVARTTEPAQLTPTQRDRSDKSNELGAAVDPAPPAAPTREPTLAEQRASLAAASAVAEMYGAKITLVSSQWCRTFVSVRVTASNLGLFSENSSDLATLINAAREKLAGVCSDLAALQISGFASDVHVYNWSSKRGYDWRLDKEGGPLPAAIAKVSQLPKDYDSLIALLETVGSFRQLDGFDALIEASVIDAFVRDVLSDTDPTSTAEISGSSFDNFIHKTLAQDNRLADSIKKIESVLTAIQQLKPDSYATAAERFQKVSGEFPRRHWELRISSIIDDEKSVGFTISEIVRFLEQQSHDPQLLLFVDDRTASWLKDIYDTYQEIIPEGFASDVASFEILHGELRTAQVPSVLSKSIAQAAAISTKLQPITEARLEQLKQGAIEIVSTTGSTYEDADHVLEIGFALAEEFEESFFGVESATILQAALDRANALATSDLASYSAELANLPATSDNAAGLAAKADTFRRLAADLPAYESFAQVTAQRKAEIDDQLCTKLIDVVSPDGPNDAPITIGITQPSLRDFACLLNKNGHEIVGFAWDAALGGYKLTIVDRYGDAVTLKVTQGWSLIWSAPLTVEATVGETVEPITREKWEQLASSLFSALPSGTPGSDGVRECDRMAGDPLDGRKLVDGRAFDADAEGTKQLLHAIDACVAAVEDANGDPRQHYQLARVLWLAGEVELASEALREAVDQRYPAALHLAAEIHLMASSGEESEFEKSYEMFKRAADAGDARSAKLLSELEQE